MSSSSSRNPAGRGDEAAGHGGLGVYGTADGDGAADGNAASHNFGVESGGRKRKATVMSNASISLVGNKEHLEVAWEDSWRTEKENKDSKSQIDVYKYIEENENLRVELGLITKEMQDMQAKNDGMMKWNEELRSKYNCLVKLKEELQTDNGETMKWNEELLAKNNGLTKQNEELQAKNVGLMKQNDELQTSMMNWKGKVHTENGGLRKQNEELHAKNDGLMKQNMELRKQNRELHAKNGGLAKRNNELQAESDDLMKHNEELQAKNDGLRKQNKEIGRLRAHVTKILVNQLKANNDTLEEIKEVLEEYDTINEEDTAYAAELEHIQKKNEVLSENLARKKHVSSMIMTRSRQVSSNEKVTEVEKTHFSQGTEASCSKNVQMLKKIWFGCLPKMLYTVISKLSGDQKNWVQKIEFDSLLSLQSDGLPKKLTLWLMDKVDTKNGVIQIGDKKIAMRPLIHKVLGVPSGNLRIRPVRAADPNADPLYMDFSGTGKETGRGISADKINWEAETNEERFCITFMLVALCLYLAPGASRCVNRKFLPILSKVEKIKEYNWCDFILDHLLRSIKTYREAESATVYIQGCTHILGLIFLDFAVTNSDIPRGFPRVSYVKDYHLAEVEENMEDLSLMDISKTVYADEAEER